VQLPQFPPIQKHHITNHIPMFCAPKLEEILQKSLILFFSIKDWKMHKKQFFRS
jgi:hypothetical protein